MNKRIFSMLLVFSLVLGCASALAENTKHERVYAVTSADGAVQSLTDNIRLENADGLDTLSDMTMLTGIENISGSETFTQDEQQLIWQANGNSIIYQGTSDKELPLTPVVTVLLNGQEIPAAQLKEATGTVEMTVGFRQTEAIPHLAVSVLLLPETGINGLTLENASVLSVSGKQVLAGWAVPGADAALNLPDSFSFRFEADHPDLGWMMTFASADPIQAVCQELDRCINMDWYNELAEATALLEAMRNGEPLPETTGLTKELPGKITELNNGLQSLNDGAQTLADGAAALNTGLSALSANSETLNNGADTIFAALLTAANQQLSTSGLSEAGIELPALTAENYKEVLTAVISQLEPETVKLTVRTEVESVVRGQVEANKDQIREGVTQAIQAQVLEQVLTAAGLKMDAETYLSAVEAGQVDAVVAQQVQTAVDAQMETDPVKELIETTVTAQVDQLISDNTDQVMAEDETVAAKMAQAQSAHDTLQGLLDQLDQVAAFVTGLKTYTAGVDQAAAGAAELSAGAAALHDSGTDTLQTSILGTEKALAEKLLPMVTDDLTAIVQIYDTTSELTQEAGYDYRPDGMNSETVYIIRTDFE